MIKNFKVLPLVVRVLVSESFQTCRLPVLRVGNRRGVADVTEPFDEHVPPAGRAEQLGAVRAEAGGWHLQDWRSREGRPASWARSRGLSAAPRGRAGREHSLPGG